MAGVVQPAAGVLRCLEAAGDGDQPAGDIVDFGAGERGVQRAAAAGGDLAELAGQELSIYHLDAP